MTKLEYYFPRLNGWVSLSLEEYVNILFYTHFLIYALYLTVKQSVSTFVNTKTLRKAFSLAECVLYEFEYIRLSCPQPDDRNCD